MEKKVFELSQGELEGEVKEIFNHSAIALQKAVETYVKSDIIALNNLYSEKVGE